jgi:hypothetical protein
MIWLSLITVSLSLMEMWRLSRFRQAQCRLSVVRPDITREHRFFLMPAEKLSSFARQDSRRRLSPHKPHSGREILR